MSAHNPPHAGHNLPADLSSNPALAQVANDPGAGPPNDAAAAEEMIRREVIIDYRPGAGIRMAPHFYNTMDEVELLARGVRRAAEVFG